MRMRAFVSLPIAAFCCVRSASDRFGFAWSGTLGGATYRPRNRAAVLLPFPGLADLHHTIFVGSESLNRKITDEIGCYRAATVFINSTNAAVFCYSIYARVTNLDLIRCFLIRRLSTCIILS